MRYVIWEVQRYKTKRYIISYTVFVETERNGCNSVSGELRSSLFSDGHKLWARSILFAKMNLYTGALKRLQLVYRFWLLCWLFAYFHNMNRLRKFEPTKCKFEFEKGWQISNIIFSHSMQYYITLLVLSASITHFRVE